MLIKNNAGHISFQFEENDAFWALGYKVLEKQKIQGAIPCLRIKYNGFDKILYKIEEYEPLRQVIGGLREEEVIEILQALFQLQADMEENGFLPKEAAVIDLQYLYWNASTKALQFMILPVNGECRIGDGRNWYKRYHDTIEEMAQFVRVEKREQILFYVQNLDNVSARQGYTVHDAIAAMKQLKAEVSGVAAYYNAIPNKRTELRLVHMGQNGNFAFQVRKQEFIIGKKRDSVDGFIGISSAVSRIHCKIITLGNSYYITDMGSVNHTYVNGMIVGVQERRELHNGDMIKIADVDMHVQISS